MVRHGLGTFTEVETGAMVLGVAVADEYVYVAGEGGLRIVDLLAPGGPEVIGRCVMPGVAESVEILDGLAYVAGGEWGIRVVDVTVPTDPIEIGVMDTARWAADLAVDWVAGGPVAVVADTEPSLLVVDAADPAVLEPVVFGGLGSGVFAVDAAGGYAYAANIFGSYLWIFDISTPAQPELVGEWDAGGGDIGHPTAGLAVEGDYAFVAGKRLVIVDVSDPTQSAEISRIDLFGRGKDVAVAQDQVAVAVGEAIHFIDASDPHAPIEQEFLYSREHRTEASVTTRTQGHVIGFGGKFSFIEYGDPGTSGGPLPLAVAGLHVFEVGDSGQPRLVGVGLEDQMIWDADGAGDLVYAVTGDGLFRVVDVSDPSQPSQIGGLAAPVTSEDADQDGVDIEVQGNLAVVAGDLGLIVIDITEPTSPVALGELPGPCFGVEFVGDRVYVADRHNVYVVDLGDPAAPTVTSSHYHPDVTDFKVAGGYAYLVSEVDEFVILKVVDLEIDDRWTLVGELTLVDPERYSNWWPRNGVLSIAGNRLALALSNWNNPYGDPWAIGAVAMIDVSDPTDPTEVVQVVTPAEARSVMFDGGRVYIGDGRGGLAVYRYPLFADGFESGGTGRWSVTVP
jgi:hypothetical protein